MIVINVGLKLLEEGFATRKRQGEKKGQVVPALRKPYDFPNLSLLLPLHIFSRAARPDNRSFTLNLQVIHSMPA
jgi:hypothetical protein